MQTVPGAAAPFERSVTVTKSILLLKNREACAEVPIQSAWGTLRESLPEKHPVAPVGWQSLFGETAPTVTPQEAFSSVLLYPDDDTEIGELASQPFVADYLDDSFEQNPALAAARGRANAVLIDNFDAAITTCINLNRPRSYTVLYRHPAYAQKQAQAFWQTLAKTQRLDWIKGMSFLPDETGRNTAYGKPADLLYIWIPFAIHANALKLHEAIRAIAGALAPGGLAFVVGPSSLQSGFQVQQLRVMQAEPVESLPTFSMHQTILPKARLKAGLTLFHLAKG